MMIEPRSVVSIPPDARARPRFLNLPRFGERLRAYRKEWDESRGVWKDRPRHDDASHGADAFLTFACSNYQPPSAYVHRKRILRGIV